MLSKPARARHGECLGGARRGVQPAEPLQFVVPERLHAEAETIDAGRRESPSSRSGVTVSGLASSVISASAVTVNAVAAARR